MPRGSNPNSKAQLIRGDQGQTPLLRTPGGKLDSSRNARGREFAAELLGRPEYRRRLYKRILAGKAQTQELYLLQLLYGAPPKPKEEEDESELHKHFEEMRERLNKLLTEQPELARLLAQAQAKTSARLLPMPAVRKDDGDEIL